MVMGKHWVAQRVPDDEVVIVSNVNLINEIDLKDKKNFLGSKDIIDYAIKRGWYNPKKGKPFNFQDAYNYPSKSKFYKKYGCDSRQWRGQCLVIGKNIKLPVKGDLPFSVKPSHKLCVEDIRNILSDHLEGTEFDKSNGYKSGSPHKLMTSADGMICNRANQEIAIFQLRNWMPPELGCIYWKTTAASCSSVLTPWYLGITSTPDIYYIPVDIEENLKLDFHFNPPKGTFEYNGKYAFWIFNSMESLVDLDYAKMDI
jgi:dipeptidase